METATGEEMKQCVKIIYEEFNEHAVILACYMNHEDIDAARNAIVALRSAANHHHKDEVLSAAEMTRSQLNKLRDIDSVRLENVL